MLRELKSTMRLILVIFCLLLITLVRSENSSGSDAYGGLLQELSAERNGIKCKICHTISVKYNIDPSIAHINNLMGVIEYHRQNFTAASFHFGNACELDNFYDAGYIRNYLAVQKGLNITLAINTLSNALRSYPKSEAVLSALVESLSELTDASQARALILHSTLQAPRFYQLWLLLVENLLRDIPSLVR